MKKFEEFVNENTYVRDLSKIKTIIRSCKTEKQVESAEKAFDLWKKKWDEESSSQDIQELIRKIQDKYEETKL